MNIKKILEDNTKLPTAEHHFIKPPNLPYIVFIVDNRINGTSADNLIFNKDITVELYMNKLDYNLIDSVREIIINKIINTSDNDEEIEIEENIDYIEEEQMYMAAFVFNLVKKGGKNNG